MQPVTAGKPKRKAGGPSGKPGPRSGRSPHKRVQDWIKDAADRAEGIAEPSEPILDKEDRERGKRYGLDLETVKDTRKRVADVAVLTPELPDLNPRHLAFVEALVTGAAANAVEAYTIAYGTKHASRASLWQKASLLATNPRIQEWLAAYRMAALDDMMTTADRHIGQLARIRELAIAKGDLKAAGIAEVSRGKVAGLYQEHLVVEHRAGDGALIDALTRTLGAETAQQLAVALGVKATPGDSARPMVLDHATGDPTVMAELDDTDKGED